MKKLDKAFTIIIQIPTVLKRRPSLLPSLKVDLPSTFKDQEDNSFPDDCKPIVN